MTVSADAHGNRPSVKVGNSTTTTTYDGEDRIQQLGNVSYTFSPLGQLAEKKEGASVTRYQFDAVGTLQKVTLPNNQAVEYELDAAGRRVGRNPNGVKQKGWLYDGAIRIIAETDAAGTVTKRFVYATQGHSPDFMVREGKNYRLVKDALGSVRLVVDSVSGEVKQRIDYDVWGNVTSDTAPGFQSFGFAGGLLDSDTGLTRFGAREYDADSGRWVSKDPIGFAGGDSNLFAYVGNRPIGGIDPKGLRVTVVGKWPQDNWEATVWANARLQSCPALVNYFKSCFGSDPWSDNTNHELQFQSELFQGATANTAWATQTTTLGRRAFGNGAGSEADLGGSVAHELAHQMSLSTFDSHVYLGFKQPQGRCTADAFERLARCVLSKGCGQCSASTCEQPTGVTLGPGAR
jgi:RHS repeat-associated protein